MGSTEIINQSRPLDMKIGNYRYSTKLATVDAVDAHKSYTMHIKYDDTYMECSLGTGDNAENSVIVNSDACVDNKTITVRLLNGKYDVTMEPRPSKATLDCTAADEPTGKKLKWRYWGH